MTKEAFCAIAGFPGVIGLIDGTSVSILTPPDKAYLYHNKHQQYTVNVMATCNAQGIFTYESVRVQVLSL